MDHIDTDIGQDTPDRRNPLRPHHEPRRLSRDLGSRQDHLAADRKQGRNVNQAAGPWFLIGSNRSVEAGERKISASTALVVLGCPS